MFEEPNPFNKGVEGQCISIHKQEDPEPRGGQKSIESKVAQSHQSTRIYRFNRQITASSDSGERIYFAWRFYKQVGINHKAGYCVAEEGVGNLQW